MQYQSRCINGMQVFHRIHKHNTWHFTLCIQKRFYFPFESSSLLLLCRYILIWWHLFFRPCRHNMPYTHHMMQLLPRMHYNAPSPTPNAAVSFYFVAAYYIARYCFQWIIELKCIDTNLLCDFRVIANVAFCMCMCRLFCILSHSHITFSHSVSTLILFYFSFIRSFHFKCVSLLWTKFSTFSQIEFTMMSILIGIYFPLCVSVCSQLYLLLFLFRSYHLSFFIWSSTSPNCHRIATRNDQLWSVLCARTRTNK